MISNTTRLVRLRVLRDVIDTIPDAEFQMDRWYDTECGTRGCLIGHAAHRRLIPGLYMSPDISAMPQYDPGEDSEQHWPDNRFESFFGPSRVSHSGVMTAASMLSITYVEAAYLAGVIYARQGIMPLDAIRKLTKANMRRRVQNLLDYYEAHG